MGTVRKSVRANVTRMIGIAALVGALVFLSYPSKSFSADVLGVTNDTILIGMHNAMSGPAALFLMIGSPCVVSLRCSFVTYLTTRQVRPKTR